MEAELNDGDLERAIDALGESLLGFVCASPLEPAEAMSPAARVIIRQINDVLSTAVDGQNDPVAMKQYLRYRMGDFDQGDVVALALHRQAGGVVAMPAYRDRLDHLVSQLALQCYPLLLMPPEEPFLDMPGFVSSRVSSLLFHHPLAQEFQESVLANDALAAAFTEHGESSGYSTRMIFRSTGSGSSVQLWSLLSIVIGGAWRTRPEAPAMPDVNEFARQVVRRWHVVKRILTGRSPRPVQARMAFTGIRLPGAASYDFGPLSLRSVGAKDQDYVPKGLPGQLTGTDAQGNSVAIDYAGDVVVEVELPYGVEQLPPLADDSFPEFPQRLLDMNNLEDLSRRLRMSLLFAVERGHRVQIVSSWQLIDDPLGHAPSVGWSDPRQSVGLMPTQLTDDEMESWRTWFDRLGAPGGERLAVAMTRVLRASAERRDPVDVLIDSVIAWENAFGSSEGEPTLRVTASMARLLEQDPALRNVLRAKLAKIYALRSNAVHGLPIGSREFTLCYDALDQAIRALKVLFTDRLDLLAEANGTDRTNRLLLE
jgi:hypothetical protein